MTDDNLAGMFLILLIGGTIGIVALAIHGDSHREQLQTKCESKGGVLLDRTYQSGKTTGHNYTCIQPGVLIDMGE